MISSFGIISLVLVCVCAGQQSEGVWIWRSDDGPTPQNVFTLFRTTIVIPSSVSAPYMRIAANNNAAIFLNGELVTRKVLFGLAVVELYS